MDRWRSAPASQLPIVGEYDVVVAGGGVAGFAAGVAAARRGAKTLVVEQLGFLGGSATAGMVGQMLGFTEGQWGIRKELVERLVSMNGSSGYYEAPLADTEVMGEKMPYDIEVMKVAMDEMLTEAGGDVLFHSRVVDVETMGGVLLGMVINGCAGHQLIKGKVFIDATFHGDLAAWSGCKWEKGRPGDGKLQPATLSFRVRNVDLQRFKSLPREERKRLIEQGIREGRLFTRFIIVVPSINRDEGILNMSRVLDVDPLDIQSLSRAEMEGRIQVQKILSYLREKVPGFERAVLVQTGTILGLRDSRRIMGKHVLSKEDIMEGVRPEDAIAICSYPIDVHDPSGTGLKLMSPEKGKYYIPYRCLVTEEVKNLVLAGRCISATYEAHASLRVMPTCLALGEAAGLAASLSVGRGVNANELDGSWVSEALREQGVLAA